MTVASHISSLYKALPVYLWVEDEDTRTYLETVWQDGEIGILVAGGLGSVAAAVKSAHGDKLEHVFGLRDRDFGASNRARWGDPTVHVFVGDAFEVESYLLDAQAMAACDVNSSGKTAGQIEGETLAIARDLAWWMACRATIASVRDSVVADFIEHPPRAKVQSLQQGLDAIVASPWWTTALPRIPTLNAGAVEAQLKAHHGAYSALLANEGWRQSFSAKEIFVQLLSSVYTKKRPADPEGRLDFVKAIAERQRVHGSVPAEVNELRAALRTRVGH